MTALIRLPDLAAPPADERSNTMLTETTDAVLNGLVETNLPLHVDIPQIALRDGDLLVRNPDGDLGGWRVEGQRRDQDGCLVVTYTTLNSGDGEFTFSDPGEWVRVDAGRVRR